MEDNPYDYALMSRDKEQTSPRRIPLSFDIEEFDVPREHGAELPMEEQARISVAGTEAILDILKEHQVKATFFSTANFAQLAQPSSRASSAKGMSLPHMATITGPSRRQI